MTFSYALSRFLLVLPAGISADNLLKYLQTSSDVFLFPQSLLRKDDDEAVFLRYGDRIPPNNSAYKSDAYAKPCQRCYWEKLRGEEYSRDTRTFCILQLLFLRNQDSSILLWPAFLKKGNQLPEHQEKIPVSCSKETHLVIAFLFPLF
ncbi:hypothetical protein EGI15_10955 [Chryseobacterium cucumeris]|uniref:Uncharacterized protein n=1 Tax=Chryseobacterium cucumeris TaxID=1813611 RepID=A0ABX9X8Z5_9FLAO|nr:hypothetical protein EGI15_10955 [Chryseobacterium cucumeris]